MRTRSSYRDYLSSETWLQRRRTYLYDHDDCNRCGMSRENAKQAYDQDLNVHHVNYLRLGRELDNDLEALCRRCHEIESFGKTDLLAAHLSPSDWIALRSLISGPYEEVRN